ncbi:hypothetical protein LTR93_011993, partial [Exophiala xenobiotica]
MAIFANNRPFKKSLFEDPFIQGYITALRPGYKSCFRRTITAALPKLYGEIQAEIAPISTSPKRSELYSMNRPT